MGLSVPPADGEPPDTINVTGQAVAVTTDPRVLVISANQRQFREIAPVLKSLVRRVDFAEILGQTDEYDLIVADYNCLKPPDFDCLQQLSAAGKRLLLIAGADCRGDFAQLFGRRLLTNLVARNQSVEAEDLVVTVQKLVSGNIFGLEQYFTGSVKPLVLKSSNSRERRAIAETAQGYATGIGVHPRLVTHFATVTDELVTNALYNAPVDGAGNFLYSHLARDEEVDLGLGNEIEVKLACDGRRLGISVSDRYGSLTEEKLFEYLSKCFRKGKDQVDQKQGGAGIGLYFVFEQLSHFVVNISPGVKTEMLGLLDIRGGFKDFALRNKSFNVFTVPGPPAP